MMRGAITGIAVNQSTAGALGIVIDSRKQNPRTHQRFTRGFFPKKVCVSTRPVSRSRVTTVVTYSVAFTVMTSLSETRVVRMGLSVFSMVMQVIYGGPSGPGYDPLVNHDSSLFDEYGLARAREACLMNLRFLH